MQLLLVQFCLV